MLSDGDGKLHEPSMSAFLGYLLDVNADHGLGSALLELFLKPIVLENKDVFKELIKNDKEITSLSVYSNFIVEVDLECKLEESISGKKRDIDILVEIWKKNQNREEATPTYIFGIENKIRDNIDEKQLNDEIFLLKEYSNIEYNAPSPIGFVFLTPGESSVNISDTEVKIKNFIWNKPKNDEKCEDSIYCILSEILKKEACGECEPIFEYTRHTIKALMKFIESGFKLYSEEKVENEKWKKVIWEGTENNYEKFKSLNKSHPSFELFEKIHKDVLNKYKNIRWRISPRQQRIAYMIDDERQKGNKFFHIALMPRNELKGFLKVKDARKIPVEYIEYKDSPAYFPRIKSEDDYEKCKHLIKDSYDNSKR
jgi:hypothetical protein